jgi:hypothetical protein
MPREITVRDTEADETFDALLFEGGNNKVTHMGDTFARVCEITDGEDEPSRQGWVEL